MPVRKKNTLSVSQKKTVFSKNTFVYNLKPIHFLFIHSFTHIMNVYVKPAFGPESRLCTKGAVIHDGQLADCSFLKLEDACFQCDLPSVETLSLDEVCCCSLPRLVSSFSSFSPLRSLSISLTDGQTFDVALLCQHLPSSLTSLTLIDVVHMSTDWFAVSMTLPHLSLSSLNISQSWSEPYHIEQFGSILMLCPSLTDLELSDCHIDDVSLARLALHLPSSAVRSLNLSANVFTHRGAHDLMTSIRQSRVRSLTLEPYQSDLVMQVSNESNDVESYAQLEEFTYHGCLFSVDPVFFSRFSLLRSLSIRYAGLEDIHLQTLCQLSSLQHLALSYQSFSSEGVAALARAISSFPLISFEFVHNSFGTCPINDLIHALPLSVTSLNLSCNQVDIEDVVWILDHLAVQSLSLRGCNLSEVDALDQPFARNRTLTSLDVTHNPIRNWAPFVHHLSSLSLSVFSQGDLHDLIRCSNLTSLVLDVDESFDLWEFGCALEHHVSLLSVYVSHPNVPDPAMLHALRHRLLHKPFLRFAIDTIEVLDFPSDEYRSAQRALVCIPDLSAELSGLVASFCV